MHTKGITLVPLSLTHLCPVDYSILTKWICPFANKGVSDLICAYYFHSILWKNTNLSYANSADPDQMPLFVASDQGLHCLHMSYLWDARQ